MELRPIHLTGSPGAAPTVVRGPPTRPILQTPGALTKKQQELARPEMVMLKEIVPSLETHVLLEILRGNEWDLDRSTDAALALFASLSAEEGTAILGSSTTARAADVDDSGTDAQHQQQPYRQRRSSSSSSLSTASPSSSGGALYPSQRGMPVLLPENFLSTPRFRLVVDRFDSLRTDFTVIFRRRNEKLGITIQEIDSEICIHTLHSRANGFPLLALEAGIKIGDILTGINGEFFSPGAEVQDVIDILHLAGPYVTLHFTRRHRPEDANGSRYHKCAQMLLDQNVITKDKAQYVTNALNRLRERVLTWDSGWISQRIQRWKLDQGLQVPLNTTNFTAHALDRLAAGGSTSRRSLDMGVSTRDLRPALSVRLLKAEDRVDHVVYVIWVMDVKSGVEWVVRRRFREFYDFRDLLVSIRASIGTIDFPPKRLTVTETAIITSERCYLLQKFLRKVSSLVCVNSLHPSTARVQLALQNFLELGERERGERIRESEGRNKAGLKNMVQVYVHSVMQMAVMDKVLSGFLDTFEDDGEEDARRAWSEEEGRRVLFSFRDFLDNLQNVLYEGIGDECLAVAERYHVSFYDQLHVSKPGAEADPEAGAGGEEASLSSNNDHVPSLGSGMMPAGGHSPSPSKGSALAIAGSADLEDDSLDDIGRGCLHVSESSDGEEERAREKMRVMELAGGGGGGGGSSVEGAAGHDGSISSSSSRAHGSEQDLQETLSKLNEDEVRSLIRSCIRRQVEIELYVASSGRLKFVLEASFAPAEAKLRRNVVALQHQPQSFYGVPIHGISPSSWDEIVYSLKDLRSRTLPHDRLDALLAASKDIPLLFMREHPSASAPLGADEFLPIFIYVLVKAQIPNLLALNEELQALCDPDKRLSESGYYLATLEAAISHLMEADPSGEQLFPLQQPSLDEGESASDVFGGGFDDDDEEDDEEERED